MFFSNTKHLYCIDELKQLIDAHKQSTAISIPRLKASDDFTEYDVQKCTLWKMIISQIHLLLHKTNENMYSLF